MLSRFALSTSRLATATRRLSTTTTKFDIFNPTVEHTSLREMLRNFVETEVEPQAQEYNREEKFNKELFKKVGELGLLGITADPEYGGSGMDAVAAVIAHGKILLFIHFFFSFHIIIYIYLYLL